MSAGINKESTILLIFQEGESRLDVYLSKHLSNTSRRRARVLCEDHLVLVNGRTQGGGFLLKHGDVIQVLAAPGTARARPELVNDPLKWIEVLFEDDHLLIISKPRAMPSVTLRENDPLTLADCIAAYCPACAEASSDLREAGLMQRLDFYTSGIVMVAKRSEIWQQMRLSLANEQIPKTYLALAQGKPIEPSFVTMSKLVATAGGKRMKAMSYTNSSRIKLSKNKQLYARTRVSLVRSCSSSLLSDAGDKDSLQNGLISVLRATARSARRHQIRAHLSGLNYPLVGDELYEATSRLPKKLLPELLVSARLSLDTSEEIQEAHLKGFLLHAETIRFIHPVSKRHIFIKANSVIFQKISNLIKLATGDAALVKNNQADE